jgi:hypothetical protein
MLEAPKERDPDWKIAWKLRSGVGNSIQWSVFCHVDVLAGFGSCHV